MHMADALLTPAVAGVMYAASAVVAGASIVELHKEEKQDLTSAAKKLPTMAVMSALVFAGQMINYTIPGTGSSGHLCGGLLLTSVLGPWAGFLSMIVILTIQCLFFADGGLLALGANVWNMAFYGCFVGYFLIYRPLMRSRCFARRGERAANRLKITLASVLGCVLTLQLGAFSVVLETTLSGITDLPFGAFCAIVIYGGIMNPASVLMWAGAETLTWKTLLTYYVTGFPVDCVHAAATVFFLWIAAEPMLEKLDRIKIKYGLVE